jgi:ankyrin repeat protein
MLCANGGAVCGGEFDSQDGWTALMWAAAKGHAECVRLLIDVGADKEAQCDVRFGFSVTFFIFLPLI